MAFDRLLCVRNSSCIWLWHDIILCSSHNGLKRLPESLGQLKSLRSLLLHHNQIMELTEGVGQLHDLEDLVGIIYMLAFNELMYFFYEIRCVVL